MMAARCTASAANPSHSKERRTSASSAVGGLSYSANKKAPQATRLGALFLGVLLCGGATRTTIRTPSLGHIERLLDPEHASLRTAVALAVRFTRALQPQVGIDQGIVGF